MAVLPETDAQRWLRFAQEDLDAARSLAELNGFVPRIVCFSAQQAAEKAIKAVLVDQGIEFPRTHTLIRLLTLLPASMDIDDATKRDWDELSDWAVESRYPADLPEAMESDAERAVLLATGVLNWALGHIS
jgi:HEPN domain-containing protein